MGTGAPGERRRFTAIEADGRVLLAVTEVAPAEFSAPRAAVDRVLAGLAPV